MLPGLGGWLAGPAASRRARRAAARRMPQFGSGGGRAGDGWIGSSAAARAVASRPISRQALAGLTGRPHSTGVARLRSGVAGSAAGGQLPRTLPARPVHLRLAGSSRRPDGGGSRSGLRGGARGLGALGRGALGNGRSARRTMDRFGRRRGRGSFRPVVLTGGAARGPGSRLTPATPRFRTHSGGTGRGTAGLSAVGGTGQPTLRALRQGQGQPRRLRMNGRRGDGMLGRAALSTAGGGSAFTGPGGWSAPPRGWTTRSRMPRSRTSRAAIAPVRPGRSRPAPRFRSRPMVTGRAQSGKRPRFSHRRWPGADAAGPAARRAAAVVAANGRRTAAGR